MKTPEQWVSEYNSERFETRRKLVFRDGSLVRAIQHDARADLEAKVRVYENEVLRLTGLLRVANTERNDARAKVRELEQDLLQIDPDRLKDQCNDAWAKVRELEMKLSSLKGEVISAYTYDGLAIVERNAELAAKLAAVERWAKLAASNDGIERRRFAKEVLALIKGEGK